MRDTFSWQNMRALSSYKPTEVVQGIPSFGKDRVHRVVRTLTQTFCRKSMKNSLHENMTDIVFKMVALLIPKENKGSMVCSVTFRALATLELKSHKVPFFSVCITAIRLSLRLEPRPSTIHQNFARRYRTAKLLDFFFLLPQRSTKHVSGNEHCSFKINYR
jgi:hypothetical protein